MRIGVNTLFLVPGDVGGTEVYLRETLKAMAALAVGETLVLFTNCENDSLLRADLAAFSQVEFHQIPCRAAARPLRILAEQFLLPFAVRKARVDALWSPGYTAPAVCFSPQAVTVHDLQYKTCPEDMSWVERTALDILVQTACRRCQAVIAISNFSRQEIIRHGFAEGAKVHAVLNGVSKDFANSLASEGEIDLLLDQLSVRRPFLLCVAHSYPHKNLDKLVDAFALLQEEIPHQLVLVGKGRRGEEALRKSLRKIKNQEQVLRLSGLTEQELRVLYQSADLFVLPSAYEGFGLPVIEALSAGLTVLTVRAASLPEVGGEAAFYVDAPQPGRAGQGLGRRIHVGADSGADLANFTQDRGGKKMKKALISGVSGQDGAYLAQLLLENGYAVYGASRDAQVCSFANLRRVGIFEQVRTLSIAINDFRSVLNALQEIEPDEVYNLAGQSSVGLSFEQPVETLESISTAALNFLEAIRFTRRPIRFYNAGSSECFGDTGGAKADEETPFRPRSPYAVAKASAHWIVANYREAYNLFACTGILFNHESPLRPERFVTGKIIAAACRIAAGSEEKLHLGNMDIRRDWGWAPDYVRAMHLMLQQDRPQDYVIATGRSCALEDFVRLAFAEVGLDWREHVIADKKLLRPTDIREGCGNPAKAERELGWKAAFQLEDVVREMVRARKQASSPSVPPPQ